MSLTIVIICIFWDAALGSWYRLLIWPVWTSRHCWRHIYKSQKTCRDTTVLWKISNIYLVFQSEELSIQQESYNCKVHLNCVIQVKTVQIEWSMLSTLYLFQIYYNMIFRTKFESYLLVCNWAIDDSGYELTSDRAVDSFRLGETLLSLAATLLQNNNYYNPVLCFT